MAAAALFEQCCEPTRPNSEVTAACNSSTLEFTSGRPNPEQPPRLTLELIKPGHGVPRITTSLAIAGLVFVYKRLRPLRRSHR